VRWRGGRGDALEGEMTMQVFEWKAVTLRAEGLGWSAIVEESAAYRGGYSWRVQAHGENDEPVVGGTVATIGGSAESLEHAKTLAESAVEHLRAMATRFSVQGAGPAAGTPGDVVRSVHKAKGKA
jgi:hypothetical protein